ncbi:MAG: hypothetical protein ABI721_02110 [Candidatus Dojkabacteria bacterium]
MEETKPEKKKSNKKIIIIVLLIVLSLCCVVCAGLTYVGYQGVVDAAKKADADAAKILQDEKPVKVTPTTNEPISTEDSSYKDFKIGDSIRINNVMVVTVVSAEEYVYNNSFGDFADPFNGTYYIFKVEMTNISDKKVYTPTLSLYDMNTGVSDSIGTVIKQELSDFPLYVNVDPGKKVSGYIQFEKTADMAKENLYVQVTDHTLLTDSKIVNIKAF